MAEVYVPKKLGSFRFSTSEMYRSLNDVVKNNPNFKKQINRIFQDLPRNIKVRGTATEIEFLGFKDGEEERVARTKKEDEPAKLPTTLIDYKIGVDNEGEMYVIKTESLFTDLESFRAAIDNPNDEALASKFEKCKEQKTPIVNSVTHLCHFFSPEGIELKQIVYTDSCPVSCKPEELTDRKMLNITRKHTPKEWKKPEFFMSFPSIAEENFCYTCKTRLRLEEELAFVREIAYSDTIAGFVQNEYLNDSKSADLIVPSLIPIKEAASYMHNTPVDEYKKSAAFDYYKKVRESSLKDNYKVLYGIVIKKIKRGLEKQYRTSIMAAQK